VGNESTTGPRLNLSLVNPTQTIGAKVRLLDRLNAAGAIILGFLIFGLWYPITEKITGNDPYSVSYFRTLDDKLYEIFDYMIVRLTSKGYDVCPCYNHYCLRMVLFHPARFIIESQEETGYRTLPELDDDEAWDAWAAEVEETERQERAKRPWYLK
jgi:hypothetical protein